VTAPILIALLGAVTFIAISVACVATLRTRAAVTALRAIEAERNPNAGDITHDLNDLLTAINGHTELLIAGLDPSSTSVQDAHEIQRAVLSAARLTARLRTSNGGHSSSTDATDVNAVTARATAPLHTSAPVAGSDPTSPGTPLTALVLVVEDEPRVRELMRMVLARAGHEVVAVAGPHAALAALNRQPAISLMLVDVVMPEMDGYDLVAEARKIAPDVHVVFTSGFARDTARHPSGDGFLAKPFTIESLTGIVAKALS
jgi:CheY-like chemotaxis protein